jgi:hypothetical protein
MTPKTPIKVTALNNPKHLNQLYGMGWECAWVHKDPKTGEYKQVNELAYCKDYLSDVMWAHYNKKSCEIYGMRYVPGTSVPLDVDKARVIIRDTGKSAEELNAEGLLALRAIRALESVLKIKRTTLRKAHLVSSGKETAILLFEADPVWMTSTVSMSLYALILRLGRFCGKTENAMDFLRAGYKNAKAVKKTDNGVLSSDIRYMMSGVDSGGLQFLMDKGFSIFHKEVQKNFLGFDVNGAHCYGFSWWGSSIRQGDRNLMGGETMKSWTWPWSKTAE